MGNRLVNGLQWVTAAARRSLTPSAPAWFGAAVGLYALLGFMVLWGVSDLLPRFTWSGLGGALALYGYLVLFGALLLLLLRLAHSLKPPFRLAFFLVLPVAGLFAGLTWQSGAGIALVVLFGGLCTFSGALVSLITARAWRAGSVCWLVLGAAVLGLGLHALLTSRSDPNPALAGYHLRGHTLDLPDPGKPGPHSFTSFTYGPGTSLRRAEYRTVRLTTPSVDGSKFDTQWSGFAGQLRRGYWGFDARHMPLQARVWLPEGAGPFPLVLIVHGNHVMDVPSDAGYTYLGEHLASHGFIVVSVDETFLNSADSDQLTDPLHLQQRTEIPVRAWLLLKHLEQWRAWAGDAGSPLNGKVDMDHIALIGHSRGGEAVALAQVFNDLGAFPDDATLPFNFHFSIKGIVAIAPSDGSYRLALHDQSYLALAGSRDADPGLVGFLGAAQYSRASFRSGKTGAFKASLYIKDANHGQFNTTWGRNDSATVYRFLLDERPILAAPAQRQIAKAYLCAFLEVTLKGKSDYRALFQDPRNGAAWLPDDFMVSNYADSQTRWLATYEEDADPRSGSDPAAVLTGRGLSVWREAEMDLRHASLGTHAAFLAWDERMRPPAASYEIAFREPVRAEGTDLVFSASQAEIDTLPADFPVPGPRRNPDRAPLDWTIVLSDAQGQKATLALSHDKPLYPQLKADPQRGGISGGPLSEMVLQRFRFPLSDFAAGNPRIDLEHLAAISFLFDRSPRGAIALDDVGLAPE